MEGLEEDQIREVTMIVVALRISDPDAVARGHIAPTVAADRDRDHKSAGEGGHCHTRGLAAEAEVKVATDEGGTTAEAGHDLHEVGGGLSWPTMSRDGSWKMLRDASKASTAGGSRRLSGTKSGTIQSMTSCATTRYDGTADFSYGT